MHPHFRVRQSGEGDCPTRGRVGAGQSGGDALARPAAEGEDTGAAEPAALGRRLPVDVRSPGCWADVTDGKILRAGVSGLQPVEPSPCLLIPRSPAATFDFRKGSKEGGLFGASFGLSGLRVGELESVKILLESRYSPGVGR